MGAACMPGERGRLIVVEPDPGAQGRLERLASENSLTPLFFADAEEAAGYVRTLPSCASIAGALVSLDGPCGDRAREFFEAFAAKYPRREIAALTHSLYHAGPIRETLPRQVAVYQRPSTMAVRTFFEAAGAYAP